jgi:hypothetical protein
MYAKINHSGLLKFPYTQEDLLNENPHTNFDFSNSLESIYAQTEDAQENQSSLISVKVEMTPADIDPYVKHIRNQTPNYVNGEWVLGWSQIQKTQDELDQHAFTVAEQLNSKIQLNLQAIKDEDLEKPEWINYKQALLDMPSQQGFPWGVDWPSLPA